MHIASAGGVWRALVAASAACATTAASCRFDPRLPADWPSLTFRLSWQGARFLVVLTQDCVTFTIVAPAEREVPLTVLGARYVLTGRTSPWGARLPDQGDRIDGLLGDRPITGGTRADGSTITAGVPEPIQPPEEARLDRRDPGVPAGGAGDRPAGPPFVTRSAERRGPDDHHVRQVGDDLAPGLSLVGRGPHRAVAGAEVQPAGSWSSAHIASRITADEEVVGQPVAERLPGARRRRASARPGPWPSGGSDRRRR